MYQIRRLTILDPSASHACNRCGEADLTLALVQRRGEAVPQVGLHCGGCADFRTAEPSLSRRPIH